jgi:sulfhydrogenase subunit delta
MTKSTDRPTLAVWKFASCDGCQLTLLDCEDELLALAERIHIAYFPEATRAVTRGPYDISLVEGSITTPADAQRIRRIRRQSRYLVAIGACATAGGIQALRNFADVDAFARYVYPHPEYFETLPESTPISSHVSVDFELRGCPIGKPQLLELVNALLNHRKPDIPSNSVCQECKRKGITCLLVTGYGLCMGAVTQAGCNALCPTYNRVCFGCFGPQETANAEGLARYLLDSGVDAAEVRRLFHSYNAGANAFRNAGEVAAQ